MEKKDLNPRRDIIDHLKTAALFPQRRGEMITRALQELLISLPAIGTALVWPCQDRKVPWKIYYAGTRRESMQRWLTARLHYSLDATLSVLQKDLSKLSDMPTPHLMRLQPVPMFTTGLWIIWTPLFPLLREALDCLEEIRQILEALIEVESLEKHYFSSTSPLSDQALLEALAQGDPHALSAILSMTRLAGNAEVVAWGQVYRDIIESTDQQGAQQSGFGFTVPLGQGVHGRIITSGSQMVVVDDYRNSPYRHPRVSHILDSEQLRSIFALPIHTRSGQGKSEHVGGVLYAARRVVKPFSLAEQLLMQRVTNLLAPLPPPTRVTSFSSSGLNPISEQQAVWYKLILQANHIAALETWVGQFIKGMIIVADSDGRPYVAARNEQLEHLRAAFDSSMDGIQVIALDAPGVSAPGHIYLRSAITLPPIWWPDFFADLVVACHLIIGRMEHARDYLARQREQWLQDVLQGKSLRQLRQDGYRLGLPVEEGQLWVIAWPSQRMLTRQETRQRTLAENIVLDQLESPLLFLGDDIGVILLGSHTDADPCKLREALLTLFAPHPVWILYGMHYHSLHDLQTMLAQRISQAQKARREAHSEYLLNLQTPGLESLLANPRLSEDLHNFATKLLTPLLEYDRSKGTDLTTTFVLTQMLGSTQAVGDELGLHANTIRNRLRKAEDILGVEEASPQERIAWGFASFIWMSFHPHPLSDVAHSASRQLRVT